MSNDRRSVATQTLSELSRNFEYVLPYEQCSFLSENQITTLTSQQSTKQNIPSRILYRKPERDISLLIHDKLTNRLVSGLTMTRKRHPDANDLKFCKDFIRVFNSDITTAPSTVKDNELWASLQQTRFARAIGRFSPFTTENFVRWLRVVENASTLRYEGYAFSASIFMTKQIKLVEQSKWMKCSRFPDKLRFENAILKEKWIRALLQDPLIGLVGLSLAGSIVGAATFDGASKEGATFAPHERLIPISSAIVPGTMAFVTSPHGDLYVLFPSGATFVKSQGRWRYFNYSSLTELIGTLLPAEVIPALVRMVLDLSYERRGGLVVIIRDEKSIGKLVPDHLGEGRAN